MSTSFVTIPAIASIRRLPRIGKIRLGVKVQKADGTTYPKETDYFVVPEEVAAVYGEKPTTLDVLLPVNDLSIVMPTSYKWYGHSQEKKCEGNGEIARRYNPTTHAWEHHDCLCEHYQPGGCSRRAHLQVILPKINHGGIYQIDTTSLDALVQIQSLCAWVSDQVGRFAMVPMTLTRIPVTKRVPNSAKTKLHYPLKLEVSLPPETLLTIRRTTPHILAQTSKWQLEQPKDQNPAFDEDGVIISEEDDELDLDTPSDHDEPPPTRESATTGSVTESLVPILPSQKPTHDLPQTQTPRPPAAATAKQLQYISQLSEGHRTSAELTTLTDGLTKDAASSIIQSLQHGDFTVLATAQNGHETCHPRGTRTPLTSQ